MKLDKICMTIFAGIFLLTSLGQAKTRLSHDWARFASPPSSAPYHLNLSPESEESPPDDTKVFDPLAEDVVQITEVRQIHPYLSLTPLSIGYFVFKHGIEAGILLGDTWSIGVEYLEGSLGLNILRLDLADFNETLWLVPIRWHPFDGRFYLKAAIGERHYELALGDAFLARTTNSPLHAKIIEMRNYVFHYGFGHQWRFRNGIILDLEWFDFVIAVGGSQVDESFTDSTENLRDVRTVRRAIRILEGTPTIALFKLKIGYYF
ncbi:MAG: hypothetical protein ACOH5I_09055 [Oligoflexus sp.]